MYSIKLIFSILICTFTTIKTDYSPFVITTWEFTNATTKAWDTVFNKLGSALDAIEDGCKVCEVEQCDGTVGYGGSPDENGETTLDAMIMDGVTMNIGAVAALRNIKSAISVARHVLEQTAHTMLVGDQATQFAIEMGFQQESLSTPSSKDMWRDWKTNNCQPNFWTNVVPNPLDSCGPYSPIISTNAIPRWRGDNKFGTYNHDTIGMVVIDSQNKIAAGTSTNGARHKIPGRVGDSPIPGAGAYADDEVGGAAATGDGDVMMRFLPSFLAVEGLRNKLSPTEAAKNAINRITKHYPNFMGGVVVVDKEQNFGAACENVPGGYFPFSVYKINSNEVEVHRVACK